MRHYPRNETLMPCNLCWAKRSNEKTTFKEFLDRQQYDFENIENRYRNQ